MQPRKIFVAVNFVRGTKKQSAAYGCTAYGGYTHCIYKLHSKSEPHRKKGLFHDIVIIEEVLVQFTKRK